MRVATTDSFQGPFAADFALGEGGFKSAFVIHDKKTYGQGLAETFSNRFKEKRRRPIAGTETVNENDRDLGAVVTQVIGSDADMVYYGGEYPAAGPWPPSSRSAGFKGP